MRAEFATGWLPRPHLGFRSDDLELMHFLCAMIELSVTSHNIWESDFCPTNCSIRVYLETVTVQVRESSLSCHEYGTTMGVCACVRVRACACVCVCAVNSTGPTMQQVLELLCMSWGTRLTWLIRRQALCHVASMTYIGSLLLWHLWCHFESCHHRVVHGVHRAVPLLAALHKAPADDLLYVSHFTYFFMVNIWFRASCKITTQISTQHSRTMII